MGAFSCRMAMHRFRHFLLSLFFSLASGLRERIKSQRLGISTVRNRQIHISSACKIACSWMAFYSTEMRLTLADKKSKIKRFRKQRKMKNIFEENKNTEKNRISTYFIYGSGIRATRCPFIVDVAEKKYEKPKNEQPKASQATVKRLFSYNEKWEYFFFRCFSFHSFCLSVLCRSIIVKLSHKVTALFGDNCHLTKRPTCEPKKWKKKRWNSEWRRLCNATPKALNLCASCDDVVCEHKFSTIFREILFICAAFSCFNRVSYLPFLCLLFSPV